MKKHRFEQELYDKMLIFCMLLMFVLFACSSQKRVQNLHEVIKKPSVNWTLAEEGSTFYKEVEKYSDFAYYYDDIFDQEYLVSYTEDTKTLRIFDYNSAELISKFKIGHQIYSMYVHSVDSIFVCYNSVSGGPGTVFALFDRKGNRLAVYDLTQNMVMPDLEKFDVYGNRLKLKVTLVDNPYSLTNFCLFDNSFYLNISPQTDLKSRFYYPSMAIAPLKNVNDKMYSYMFYYPESYKQQQYFKADYMDFVVTKEPTGITDIIISNALSDSVDINRLIPRFTANDIFIIDSPEYDTLIRKDISSKFKGEMYPVSGNVSTKSTFLGFKYPYLKHDKLRNIYYRVAVHTVDTATIPRRYLYMQAGKKVREEIAQYQNWSLIITDSLLNKFDEKKFEAKQNYSPNILVTKNGIGIIKYNYQADSVGVQVVKYKITVD